MRVSRIWLNLVRIILTVWLGLSLRHAFPPLCIVNLLTQLWLLAYINLFRLSSLCLLALYCLLNPFPRASHPSPNFTLKFKLWLHGFCSRQALHKGRMLLSEVRDATIRRLLLSRLWLKWRPLGRWGRAASARDDFSLDFSSRLHMRLQHWLSPIAKWVWCYVLSLRRKLMMESERRLLCLNQLFGGSRWCLESGEKHWSLELFLLKRCLLFIHLCLINYIITKKSHSGVESRLLLHPPCP
jgi:hypothetical protein